MTPNYDLFAQNLKIVRIASGYSAREVAEKAMLRQLKRVLDIEEGRGQPKLSEVIAICRVLEVSMEDMFNRKAKATIIFE